MAILSASNITKNFGTNVVLDNVSFIINEKDKVGLVGLNGAGKTTLLKIMAGKINYDGGNLTISKGLKIGYMAQDIKADGYSTIRDVFEPIFKIHLEREKKIREIEMEMSKPDVYNDERLLKPLMETYAALTELFKNEGGFEIQSRIRGVLNGLGFADISTPLSTLSGGQNTRLALARILLESPGLLLLDEPTNYLDMGSIQWLEGFLKDYAGALVVVSHDRYFLDRVANKIFELENSHLTCYEGNYSTYIKKKNAYLDISERHEALRQKEAERLKKSIQNFISHRNYVQAKNRMRLLENLLSQAPSQKSPNKSIHIKFKTAESSGREVLVLENLSFSYGDKTIFTDVNLKVYRGERIGIIGPNGIGKSTLLKILAQQLEAQQGYVYFGHKVQPVYFAQEQEDLSLENTILEEVWEAAPSLSLTQIRSFLGSLLFSGDEVEKKISVLSGGERSRVALAKAILQGANLLLLDEPTNHLDIVSKEKLEASLREFDGTIITVSHDRYFLSKIATRIWEFTPDGIEDYDGDFEYYLEKKSKIEKPEEPIVVETKTSQRKARAAERREREQKKMAERRLKQLEQTIIEKEQELEELEHLLCKPEIYSNPDKAREVNGRYTALLAELEQLYDSLDDV